MSRRQVVVEPEFDDTQEVEDSEEERGGLEVDEGEEDDDCLGDGVPPVPGGGRVRGRGLGRKQKRGAKKEERVNQFKADDDLDAKNWTDGLNGVLRGLEQCAKGYFPGVQGSEHKAERCENLKKFHKTSVELVGARMQLEQAPQVVQKVFEDLDLEKVAAMEDDDEAFCAMLDEFEEASMSEISKMEQRLNYDDAISKDEQYEACLEVLNVFQKRKKNEDVAPNVSVSSDDAVGPSTRHSEGLEALTEYIPTHDPVTKKLIVSAVVNRKCGHVYDGKSIREFLVGVGGFAKRCPYAGCKMTVVEADLMVDEGMRRKVKQRIREEGLQ